MNYTSTRGDMKFSGAEAIVTGISPDGGLFLPENFPFFSFNEIENMKELPYPERAAAVMGKFLSDFSYDELLEYSQKAYSGFSPKIHWLDNKTGILELFHGPTSAFKDFALQMLPYLLTASLKKTNSEKEAVILTATSGDTGKAALEGFSDVSGTKICVFYPDGGTSEIQRLQMVTQEGKNALVLAISGNFDQAQSGVKKIFADKKFNALLNDKGYALTSANSINWGRLAPQIAYYFSAYCDAVSAGKIKMGKEINVCVPTGNFGNILAAYIAKLCGLPIAKFICASNENNVLTDFIKTGVYNKNREFIKTSSPSMDILVSSNLERLLYLVSGRDAEKVKGYMENLNTKGQYTLEKDALKEIKNRFSAGFCNEEQASLTIKQTFERYAYLCDTHTAVALGVFESMPENDAVTIIASTASPYKFPVSVYFALTGQTIGNEFEAIEKLTALSKTTAPEALLALTTKNPRFTKTIGTENMKNEIGKWLEV